MVAPLKESKKNTKTLQYTLINIQSVAIKFFDIDLSSHKNKNKIYLKNRGGGLVKKIPITRTF